jgi:hypothetical protein
MSDVRKEAALDAGLTIILDGAGKLADYEGRIEKGSLKVVLAIPGRGDLATRGRRATTPTLGTACTMVDGVLTELHELDLRLIGVASGAPPSVGFVVETPEGRAIYAETSLRLFLAAARTFRAKYSPDFPDLP